MTGGITEQSYRHIVATLTSFPAVERARIFGSRAKGTSKRGSDIDIVIFGEDCTEKTALALSSVLNEQTAIPYFVDVANYDSIKNGELKAHIDRVSIPLFERQLPTIV
jgi:predicted nucleotidyltransferase